MAGVLGALACMKKKSATTPTSPASSASPSISNINGASAPSGVVDQPIEINGANFQTSSASVVFTQGDITATVTPVSASAADNSLVVTVPAGNGTEQFSLPGNVTVTVESNSMTSNGVSLAVTAASTFDASAVTWTPATPLPIALTGLRAVAAPSAGTGAYVIVTGGSNGSSDTSVVYTNNWNTDGTVGPNWTTISDNQLPSSVASHAMVEADPSNSPVSQGSCYIYVLGGQAVLGGGPGGTSSVFMASVDTSTGGVGTWTLLTNGLPQALVGLTATLYHGWIYVVGGLLSDGSPSTAVYSAQVNADGSLGTWMTAANSYPLGISFASLLGYGGSLFVLNGDPASSTDPNAVGNSGGSDTVYFARVISGSVGTWTESPASTLEARKKHNTWSAFGQVMNGEGIYPGSVEIEWSLFNASSTLESWTALTNPPHANVYNAAGAFSPVLSPAGTPRFLLLGGETVASSGEGPLINFVYYNNAP
jgi:hypothetical protein